MEAVQRYFPLRSKRVFSGYSGRVIAQCMGSNPAAAKGRKDENKWLAEVRFLAEQQCDQICRWQILNVSGNFQNLY